MKATKSSIKAMYIQELKAMYPFYNDGSRPLTMASEAADSALAGKMRLEGDCWSKALAAHGLPKNMALKRLAELPND